MSNKLFVVSKMTSRKIFVTGTSLTGQWLGLHISTAGSTGSIPGQGIKILQAVQHGQKYIHSFSKEILDT